MTKLAILLAFSLGSIQAFAQSATNPISTADKNIYTGVKNNILKAAEEMPESGYAFKPSPDVRTFGQLVAHVADGQYEFCASVVADHAEVPQVEKTKTSKADLLEALHAAFSYCDKAYDNMTDVAGAEMVPFGKRTMPKLSLLTFNTAHTDEHYGNMTTYLRMKGLVPPSSQKH